MKKLITIICCFAVTLPCLAFEEVYQTPEDFISQSFTDTPQRKTLWLSGSLKPEVKAILGHDYHKLRLRYWRSKQRTAWVLEEIGKEHYITAGFVVDEKALERVKVLIYRESRGWEVKNDFFTRQFENAKLNNNSKLDKHIDNITGATLSVRAIKRLAELAIHLHLSVADA